ERLGGEIGLIHPRDALAYGVRRPLVPGLALLGQLGGEDVDEAVAERAEAVGLGDVAVQARAVELRDDEDPVDAGVQAVADRDVFLAELAAHRDRGFGTVACQGPQSGPLPATENRCDHFFHRPPPPALSAAIL